MKAGRVVHGPIVVIIEPTSRSFFFFSSKFLNPIFELQIHSLHSLSPRRNVDADVARSWIIARAYMVLKRGHKPLLPSSIGQR